MTKSWFKVALAIIFVFSLVLRFWHLDRFNTLVFDEVYYPVFANRYLLGKPVYNAHPPLSQYLITISIWLGSHFPIGQDTMNGLLGSLRTPLSYRWLNALTGSFIPIVVGAIAYHLTNRRSFGAIAALFAALDGLFLVESRFALNNIYLILFGLLGQLYVLIALRQQQNRRKNLILSGLFFGASAAIKWNGLGFLLGIYLVWCVAWFVPRHNSPVRSPSTPLQNLTQLNLFHIMGYLGIIPALTYGVSWIPHLIMNPKPGFWEMQQRIFSFHQTVGSGTNVHPYCSPWYSWLLMIRPVAYFYQTARNLQEPVPSLPPLPREAVKIVYDVHAMGNPFLWWFSTAAILLFFLLLVQRLWGKQLWRENFTASSWLGLYLLLNYCANLLPWLKVTRCTFLYHYMAASVFSGYAIAWFVDSWLNSPQARDRQIGLAILLCISAAFFFWLPLYIGLPLTPDSYKLRMWFRSWI
ncbi:phospholipid carrier-dependent glycosyltransferase [Lusitaniella coriacea LEGE 07157]|uniref:Polyprenol-phosphate-mannose--protein mannosyltransferase n=1 Tax=Lusitaniella coriacea LEGE 07157 TaxID=945747 RepID=A0A8J7DY06_9CYAN|nr:phospholipid carrier-dependent glycosyltransferase [Lusitaniella coriacea]MBE9117519.1 phospholipid carrier-dependent glycosyltransferase [Lusitaniella coriacea LEGE 07157]